jgi:hypothetical protein
MKNWYKITFSSEEVASGKAEELEDEYLRYQEADSNPQATFAALFKTREPLQDGSISYLLTPDCALYFPGLVNVYDYEMSELPSTSEVIPAVASLSFDVMQLLSPGWNWAK